MLGKQYTFEEFRLVMRALRTLTEVQQRHVDRLMTQPRDTPGE